MVVLCNLGSKKLGGVESQGMVLCAKGEGGLCFVTPPDGSAPGARVSFEGFAGEPEQNPKKLAKKKVTRGDAAREMPRVAWTMPSSQRRMREARARPWRRRRSHLAL